MKKINYLFVLLAIFSVVVFGCTSQTQIGKNTGEVKKADGTIVKADGTMIKPDGTMIKPDGTMIKPDGTMVKPDGTMVKTDGTMIKPDGTMVKPDGTMIKPNGVMVKPDGTMIPPAGSPQGTIVKEDGTIVKPDGVMVKADGTMIGPDGKVIESKQSAAESSTSGTGAAGYTGKVLAGTTTPYIDYNKEDYDKALAEGKTVVLYFYANWCPICRVEQSSTFAAFNELQLQNVVGFRVNYKDSDTTDDEVELAKQFGVTYQHTKIIIKNGERVLKAPDSWDKERYISEITKYA